MRKCSKCAKYKNLESFHKYKRSKDGVKSVCKTCRTVFEKQCKKYFQKYYQDNKEIFLKKAKEWSENNKNLIKSRQNSEKYKNTKKLSDKKYRDQKKEYLNKKSLEYYYNNKEILLKKNKEYSKNWRLTQRGKALSAAKEAKRRATKLKQTPSWADLDAIKEFYLNCPKGYHVDHIIPL